jgi:hypothetical protein
MRILLVSEGRHELALGEPECPLGELVRRTLNHNIEIERRKVSDPSVRIHAPKGKSLAYEKRALAWLKYATDNHFTALVLLIDRDGVTERDAGITSAQRNSTLLLPRAMGVAVEAFDAWMLADERALSQAFGKVVNRQPDPERIAVPKDAFHRLIEELEPPYSQTQLYLAIAKVIVIDDLERRCAQGFKPFCERLRQL